jgi:tRNA pseudouridine13 synthase
MAAEPVTQPPFITPDLPGIGGELKREPAHFVVQEIPLYLPSGQGEHVYVTFTREGWTTRSLQKRLAAVFGLRETGVGFAGLKDKDAVVTQTFSLHLHTISVEEVEAKVAEQLPVKVLEVSRHMNKLRRGHLLGNRFSILLSEPAPDSLGPAQKIAAALKERGLPNYFGEQRFGIQGDNAERGRCLIKKGKGPREKWLRQLLLSAYQSELFNLWLGRRIKRGLFDIILPGDIAKKTDTGGLFTVEDPNAEQKRFDAGEISFTGPIFGSKMTAASGRAGQMEQEILEAEELDNTLLAQNGLKGGRRRARLNLDSLSIDRRDGGLLFNFALPKGSYATTLLREFIKPDGPTL